MTGQPGSNGRGPVPSLSEPIEQLAAELPDVERRDIADGAEYVRGGVVFAVRQGDRLSFRLRPDIVEAGLRTPDTAPSARGRDWIALTPAVVDVFALDRALAWFQTAYRQAADAGT